MFINDVHKKEEIKNIAIQDLKRLGIKYKIKKTRHHVQEIRSRKVFKIPLQQLSSETVTLPSGQQLIVPKIVHELCKFVIERVTTEGLFRKGGSKSRQNEIKMSLDAGCTLSDDYHEIDVASVLKTFFRELPEPLIPYSYHELFLRCMINENQKEAVKLACLLLPTEHLNTLTYFMQFLQHVANYSKFNKMDSFNLAIVIGPTLLPSDEKTLTNPSYRLNKTCDLFKMLIEDSVKIGVLSENIIERVALTCTTKLANSDEEVLNLKKKKKRRSGSLTRMLSGLKKIVTNKSEEENSQKTPDLLLTPCLTQSSKKRKIESVGISSKKRRHIINNMPQNTLLNTPLTTPVNCHPNVNKNLSPSKTGPKILNKCDNAKEKKILWSNRSKLNKKTDESSSIISLSSSSIQRRWSAVSSAAGFKRKKSRNSYNGSISQPQTTVVSEEKDPQIDNRINDLSEELIKQKDNPEDNYVRISKVEYEEIKNRVSAIERRISIELDNAILSTGNENDSPCIENGVQGVEKAYEKTLVQAAPLSPTTDHLVRRFSRELKIRRSSDCKVFRSPSARKIGSLRRRSKENANQIRLARNQSWCVTSASSKPITRKNRPNTIQCSTLHSSAPTKMETTTNQVKIENAPESGTSQILNSRNMSSSAVSSTSTISWKSAQAFFGTPDLSEDNLENCRSSLVKLRSQNAGMVLAKAKLFDNLVDSSGENNSVTIKDNISPRPSKIGAPRTYHPDSKQFRIRALRMEERRISRKAFSPRRRGYRSPGGPRLRKLQVARGLIENNGLNSDKVLKEHNRQDKLISPMCTTPQKIPSIKKALNSKSPRRLCYTPVSNENRLTPMKAYPPAKKIV